MKTDLHFTLADRLRSAVYMVWYYTLTFVFASAGVPIRMFARHLALPLAQSWARTVLWGLGPICGIRVELTGREHIPRDGPALLAGQHQSEFDTLIWMAVLDRPSYVMKQELTRIPLFGPLLVPAGMMPVDRSAGATALRGLLTAVGRAAANARQIMIFPEGTRVAPGVHVKLQPGVAAISARLGQPVLPVATDSGLRWSRGVLGKRKGVIHVVIGPPIEVPCRREILLARIEAFWRDMEASGFKPVDNSVETRFAQGSRSPS